MIMFYKNDDDNLKYHLMSRLTSWFNQSLEEKVYHDESGYTFSSNWSAEYFKNAKGDILGFSLCNKDLSSYAIMCVEKAVVYLNLPQLYYVNEVPGTFYMINSGRRAKTPEDCDIPPIGSYCNLNGGNERMYLDEAALQAETDEIELVVIEQ